jgi:hypothetical protein
MKFEEVIKRYMDEDYHIVQDSGSIAVDDATMSVGQVGIEEKKMKIDCPIF